MIKERLQALLEVSRLCDQVSDEEMSKGEPNVAYVAGVVECSKRITDLMTMEIRS